MLKNLTPRRDGNMVFVSSLCTYAVFFFSFSISNSLSFPIVLHSTLYSKYLLSLLQCLKGIATPHTRKDRHLGSAAWHCVLLLSHHYFEKGWLESSPAIKLKKTGVIARCNSIAHSTSIAGTTWAAPSFSSYWRQRISVCHRRGTARAVQRCLLTNCLARLGGTPADFSDFVNPHLF